MADITLTNSTYSTGTNDTASTLVNNVTAMDAQQYNGAATAIVGIETVLGTGTDLKGSATDLVARLAVEHNADGTQKTLTVPKGGTGVAALTDGAVLLGNGTGVVQALALPSTNRVLIHSGTAAADPSWGVGLLYHGPSSCGAGSTRSHEGTVTISANGNYSGVHFYTDFTLNAGVTMTVPAGKRRLVIVATGTVTINGTIDATGAGAPGGVGAIGSPGTDQAGGGGGNGSNGGNVEIHGSIFQVGATTTVTDGNDATQLTGSDITGLFHPFTMMGGAGGGNGAGGNGGPGGGSIVVIAPVIVLGAASVLNTSSSAGSNNSGGFGGAGNVYLECRSYTDSGCTFTMSGGTPFGSSPFGGKGADGVKQINIYA